MEPGQCWRAQLGRRAREAGRKTVFFSCHDFPGYAIGGPDGTDPVAHGRWRRRCGEAGSDPADAGGCTGPAHGYPGGRPTAQRALDHHEHGPVGHGFPVVRGVCSAAALPSAQPPGKAPRGSPRWRNWPGRWGCFMDPDGLAPNAGVAVFGGRACPWRPRPQTNQPVEKPPGFAGRGHRPRPVGLLRVTGAHRARLAALGFAVDVYEFVREGQEKWAACL